MAGFMGGSAPAMAAQIAEGYILVSGATVKGLTSAELQTLRAEVDKILRGVRAETPAQDDALANQARNRRIGRLNQALQVIQHKLTGRG